MLRSCSDECLRLRFAKVRYSTAIFYAPAGLGYQEILGKPFRVHLASPRNSCGGKTRIATDIFFVECFHIGAIAYFAAFKKVIERFEVVVSRVLKNHIMLSTPCLCV